MAPAWTKTKNSGGLQAITHSGEQQIRERQQTAQNNAGHRPFYPAVSACAADDVVRALRAASRAGDQRHAALVSDDERCRQPDR